MAIAEHEIGEEEEWISVQEQERGEAGLELSVLPVTSQ